MGAKPCNWDRSGLPVLLLIAYSFAISSLSSLTVGQQETSAASPCLEAKTQLRLAAKALDEGNVGEATRFLAPLQNRQNLYPQCAEITLGLARLHALRKDTATADELFSRAIELAPRNAPAYYYDAQFYLSQERYQQADELSEKAVTLDPTYPDGLVLRGQILSMKGDTAAAQEMLQRACKLAPNSPDAHFQLGVFFDRRQLHPEAAEQFEKVISLRPRDPRPYDYLALNLEALSEPIKAEAAYQKGLRVNEGPLFDSFMDYNYGRFLTKVNRLAESKTHLDRARHFAPQARAVWYEHGRLNLRQQNYKEAQADAERALSLPDPSGFVLDLQVYYLLATIYSRLGDTAQAEKYAALCKTSRVPVQSQGRGDR
jgi:tetratricopeptide (TPR) repeat protein